MNSKTVQKFGVFASVIITHACNPRGGSRRKNGFFGYRTGGVDYEALKVNGYWDWDSVNEHCDTCPPRSVEPTVNQTAPRI